jgi:Tfp pilus assembly protein PilW
MTVLELMISSAVMLVVLTPVLAFLATTQRAEIFGENATTQHGNARQVLAEMQRYLREAEYPAGTTYSSTGSDLFAKSLPYDIAFFTEYTAVTGSTSAGTIDEVEYCLSTTTSSCSSAGTNLVRIVTTPTCTSGTCTYPSSNSSTRLVFNDLRNYNTASCINFSSAVPLFVYEEQEPSTGQLTTLSGGSGFINYVQVTPLTGDSSSTHPGCTEYQTSVSLRNWRP